MEMDNVFTSTNVLVLVNDQPFGAVNNLVIKDCKDLTGKFTRISMARVVLAGSQDLVELMRTQKFSFKVMNYETSGGWVSLDAELESYEMSFDTEENNYFLYQHLVVKTPSFAYAENITAEHLAAKEEEDLKNLIEILKKNQAAVRKPETGFVKYGVPPAVLPDDYDGQPEKADDIVFPEKKDRKKKKKNK